MGIAGMEKGSEGSFKWTYPAEGVAENRRFGARGRLSPHKKSALRPNGWEGIEDRRAKITVISTAKWIN